MNQIFFMCQVTTTTHIMTESQNSFTIPKDSVILIQENIALKQEIETLKKENESLKQELPNYMTIQVFEEKLNSKIRHDLFNYCFTLSNNCICPKRPINFYILFEQLYNRIDTTTDIVELQKLTIREKTVIVTNYIKYFDYNKNLRPSMFRVLWSISKTANKNNPYTYLIGDNFVTHNDIITVCNYLEIEHI